MTTAVSKAHKGIGMEGRIAHWYAATTRKSMDEYRKLAREVASVVPEDARVLEVAPGPGYFSIELAKLDCCLVDALDISKTFIEIGTRNAQEAGVEVAFRQGNVSAMPYRDETFDFIFCRAAFKNFAEPVKAIQEMYRVLKPGGQGLIGDLRKDASRQAIRELVDSMGLGFVERMFTRFTFRFMLLKRAYTKQQFREFFAGTNFRTVTFNESATGLEIRFQK